MVIIVFLLLFPSASLSAGLGDLLGDKEIDDADRRETIERIEVIQDKLKLLQDKLRALERRKAAQKAAERAGELGSKLSATPSQVNWAPVDETTVDPGDYGLYTYLLFNGDNGDLAFIGPLEDFILTIETLPANDLPDSLANKFLVPVEKPQSMINLGRQPYDFKLNKVYLDRLGIGDDLPDGPVLVSMNAPLDPFGTDRAPDYLVVAMGKQPPERAARLAGIWHQQEKDSVISNNHPVATLFWQLIDGIGPVQVSRDDQAITVSLPQ